MPLHSVCPEPQICCSVHVPFTQLYPLAQFELLVQLVGQEGEPLQTNGLHEGEPGDPAGSFVHVPALPAKLQLWHAPEQVALQHTPWLQIPLEHWEFVLQSCPLPEPPVWHAPATQLCPDGQTTPHAPQLLLLFWRLTSQPFE